MKKFSLEEYLKNPVRKVVTKSGDEVTIIYTKAKKEWPVVAMINSSIDQGLVWQFSADGESMPDNDGSIYYGGLFFADEEEGLEGYCPYKTTVESILKMFDSYSITTDKSDFIDNIRVKCKDAVEYDKLFPKHHRETEQPVEGLEEEFETEADKTFFANGWYEGDHHQPRLDISLEEFRDIAFHFAEWGKNNLK